MTKTNDECGMMNDESASKSSFIIYHSALCLPLAAKQDDVLKGISDNVGQSVDPNMLLAVLVAFVGLIGLIVAVNYLRKRTVTPKVLNHPARLMKEISKAVELKPAEVRQLKMLADQQQLSSPLLLLLCPSLLVKAIKVQRPSAADRVLIGQIAKRVMSRGSQSPDANPLSPG